MKVAAPRVVLLCVAVAAAAAVSKAARPGASPRIMPAPTVTDARFCGTVQRILAGTTLEAANAVQVDFAEFVKAKALARPLLAQQHVEYADAAKTQPMLVACKTKSADHLNAVHGPGTALGDDYPCRSINRGIVLGAWSAMPDAERAAAAWPPSRIMLDGDDVGFLGSTFVKPYTFLYRGADGLPHLRSRAQYASWLDWRWKLMPERFRGTHYCRLIAPEYARRLIRGEVPLASAPG